MAWTLKPPPDWILIPAAGELDAGALARWEADMTALVRATLAPDDPSQAEAIDAELGAELGAALDKLAAGSVATLRAFADDAAGDGTQPPDRVAAALGIQGRSPVPVLVTVGLSPSDDDGDGLMAALGATGGNPAAPPRIEHLDLPDGDGMRVTRLDMGEASGVAWLSIALGRRAAHPDDPGLLVDTVIVWRTTDLFLAPAMLPLLDELLTTVEPA